MKVITIVQKNGHKKDSRGVTINEIYYNTSDLCQQYWTRIEIFFIFNGSVIFFPRKREGVVAVLVLLFAILYNIIVFIFWFSDYLKDHITFFELLIEDVKWCYSTLNTVVMIIDMITNLWQNDSIIGWWCIIINKIYYCTLVNGQRYKNSD